MEHVYIDSLGPHSNTYCLTCLLSVVSPMDLLLCLFVFLDWVSLSYFANQRHRAFGFGFGTAVEPVLLDRKIIERVLGFSVLIVEKSEISR